MLRRKPGILMAAILILLPALDQRFCSIGLAQTGSHPADSGNAYYSRPDLRASTLHAPAEAADSRNEMIQAKYAELLSRNAPPTAGTIYPGSYRFENPAGKKYVRKNLPSRLVPPGRHDSPVAATPIQSTQQSTQQNVNQAPSWNAQSSVTVNDLKPGQSTMTLPPIVKPSDVKPAMTRPINKTPVNQAESFGNRLHQREQQPAARYPIVPVVSAATQIPSGFSRDDSQVTRATIINVQQGSDPFGQAPDQREEMGNNGTQDNPFTDPPQDETKPQNQTDPFADPPEDFQVNQQDPFGDPVQDPNQVQDPFADPPAAQPFDPFANSPQNIVPPNSFEMPADPVTPDIVDPGLAPDKPDRSDKDVILGPFKSNGFRPTPIQPAPLHREFPGIEPRIVTSGPGTQYQGSSYPDGTYQHQLSQPTLLDSGFNKSDLYEGITYDSATRLASYECAACQGTSCRPGCSLFGNLRCRAAALGSRCVVNDSACGSEYGHPYGVADCDTCFGSQSGTESYDCNSCFDGGCGVCCEPMFYFSVFGGYTQLEDTHPLVNTGMGITLPGDGILNFNNGFGIGVAIGQIQGENLRTEIEFSFRDNDADTINRTFGIVPSSMQLDGSMESFSGMINFVWDFRERPIFCRLRPYAGGGIGFAFVDTNLADRGTPIIADGYDSDSSFAYQLMAGLSRPVSARIDGFVEYRYFAADSIRINLDAPVSLGGKIEYETDNVFFGFRMHF